MPISKIKTEAIEAAAVTTAKVADSAVNSAKIGVDVIAAEDLAANSVTVSEITDGAVTSAKLDTNITIDGTLDVGGAFTSRGIDDNADATAITIDSSENIGIGTTNGDVTNDGSAARTYVGIIGTGNRGRLNIGSTASNGADSGTLAFTNGTNTLADITVDTNSGVQNAGKMYINSTDSIRWSTAGSERIRIDSDGLKFNGDTAAANALDDYEEGDFVPTITTSGGTTTYVSQKGAYTRIGRVCHIMVNLVAQNNSNVSLYNLNLPFTAGHVSSGTGWYPTIAIGNFYNVNLTSGGTMLGAYAVNGQAAARLHSCGNNTNQLAPSCTANTNFELRFEGSFIIQ